MHNMNEKQEQEIISAEEYLLRKNVIGKSETKNSHQIGDYLSELSLVSSFFFSNL